MEGQYASLISLFFQDFPYFPIFSYCLFILCVHKFFIFYPRYCLTPHGGSDGGSEGGVGYSQMQAI